MDLLKARKELERYKKKSEYLEKELGYSKNLVVYWEQEAKRLQEKLALDYSQFQARITELEGALREMLDTYGVECHCLTMRFPKLQCTNCKAKAVLAKASSEKKASSVKKEGRE
jgi:hypothetical protein